MNLNRLLPLVPLAVLLAISVSIIKQELIRGTEPPSDLERGSPSKTMELAPSKPVGFAPPKPAGFAPSKPAGLAPSKPAGLAPSKPAGLVPAGNAYIQTVAFKNNVAAANDANPQLPAQMKRLKPFFQRHCTECHGAEKQKGKLRLDTLSWQPDDEDNLSTWYEIVELMELGEMPPEDEPQPTAQAKNVAIQVIQKSLKSLSSSDRNRKETVLRRLNRKQYRNTLRDLLKIEVTQQDPTSSFPSDDAIEGFDNLGEGLAMSDFLLTQYLKVAREAINRATFPKSKPEVQTHLMAESWGPENKRVRPKGRKTRRANFSDGASPSDERNIFLYWNDERDPGDTRGQTVTTSFDGAPAAGYYDFTLQLESRGRGVFRDELGYEAQKRKEWQVYHPEDLHRFEIYLSAPRALTSAQARIRILVESMDLPDNQKISLKRRYWLQEGWRLEFAFGNAYADSTNRKIPAKIGAKFDFKNWRTKANRKALPKILYNKYKEMDGPRIIIHEARESGPHYESWPPVSHQTLYGSRGEAQEKVIRDFAYRAFRRPVKNHVLKPYYQLARKSPEGLRTAFEAILCSPRFTYFRENTTKDGKLDAYAVASRLSYFLWNSMPDDELFELAANNRLLKPDVLQAQLKRMLEDEKSQAFVSDFIWGWLGLQNTIDMAPDPMRFNDFKRYRIADSMKRETELLFEHILSENLPIKSFLSADYSFRNADLMRHYGDYPKNKSAWEFVQKLPEDQRVNTTATFKKIKLKDPRRHGLLGHASILTASANGVETSPVLRGIWVMERLLGIHPELPPVDVAVPEPDARGELTVRQLYAKHRTVETCNDCHRTIDPLGFALENFNPIGQWRTKYEGSGHQVESFGKMPNGKKFKDIQGLNKILLEDFKPFRRNLVSKLLTYATGRTMSAFDRKQIEMICDQAQTKGDGLHDILALIVTSDLFLSK